MPQLLLELFSEEIPARMQVRAGEDLERMLTGALGEAGLDFGSVEILTGPRRLTVVIEDLPEKSPDVSEERKGPRVGAPDKAIEGFLRGAGLDSIDQCEIRADKKGESYVAVINKPGRATAEIIAEVVPDICRKFPWPKSMRWAGRSERWVRPLRRILCVYGGEVVKFEFAGIESGDQTEGHRLMGPGPFTVSDYASYRAALEGEGKVMLDRAARIQHIESEARRLCESAGFEWVEDAALLEESGGLAEHPVPLLGEMDPKFLILPPEVIQLTMAKNQKYFAVRDPETGGLAPRFICVADMEAQDGGQAIAAGNARVLTARLDDARFFWEEDLKRPLAERVDDLENVVFHRKLGSVKDKAERVAALAKELAPIVGADPALAERAALLAKADLTTQMVIEFTDLQGVMGWYYAKEAGEPEAVANAIRDHYKPQGPSDEVPTEPVSVAVALADKLDTLVGFWAIDEKPTGSKDPYALRRAALGVVRIILENDLRLGLSLITQHAYSLILKDQLTRVTDAIWPLLQEDVPEREVAARVKASIEEIAPTAEVLLEGKIGRLRPDIILRDGNLDIIIELKRGVSSLVKLNEQMSRYWRTYERREHLSLDLISLVKGEKGFAAALGGFIRDRKTFDVDRLKVALREQGIRHDLIDAVFALGEDDLVAIVKRVEALQSFLATEDGENLLAGYTRAANILKAEEKKGFEGAGAPDAAKLAEPQEKALYDALQHAKPSAEAAIEAEDFEAAMAAIAPLRARIDEFFDAVTVNADDEGLRRNRLLLLGQIRESLRAVADFDRIESRS